MHSAILILVAFQLQAAVVIDRIAVVVGKHVIKTSDIDRDLRVTEFQNRTPLDLSAAARRKSAERLIDQAVIRDEISTGGYNRASDAEAEAMLGQIRRERYGGSTALMRRELARYGLTEGELRVELLWQLTVLRFIDERFSPAVLVADQDIRDYYNQHLAQLKREYPRDYSVTALESKIRTVLQGQEVNKQFEAWLDEARKNQHIEYKQEAFG
jgi:parvulin-like peptidyl-prolyl isomerase